ncbi:MAG: DUF4435 domain-containing protein [Bacteroidetes bacterium]|nr:MAG: DUF4435 domain-containing protein [Bacteroidota bacterium]
METLKKKHTEIVALYKLESEIKDIYVEGATDKVFFKSYLNGKKLDRKVFQIEIIDFSELDRDYFEGLDPSSAKSKVTILSKLLQERAPNTSTKCIIDKDFDDFIKAMTNEKLLRTDFSCLESYLFCEEVFEKFLNIGINNFPFEANFVLNQLAQVLKPLFCLRLLRELNYRFAKLVSIDGNLSINKQNGIINFNENSYIDKFINKNNLNYDKDKILQQYKETMNRLGLEIRHYINGHDFIDIFFLYINKVKNTLKYKEENFGRVLFLTIEASMLDRFPLFKKIAL